MDIFTACWDHSIIHFRESAWYWARYCSPMTWGVDQDASQAFEKMLADARKALKEKVRWLPSIVVPKFHRILAHHTPQESSNGVSSYVNTWYTSPIWPFCCVLLGILNVSITLASQDRHYCLYRCQWSTWYLLPIIYNIHKMVIWSSLLLRTYIVWHMTQYYETYAVYNLEMMRNWNWNLHHSCCPLTTVSWLIT